MNTETQSIKEAKTSRPRISIIGTAIKFLTLAGLITSLMGYGFALGIADTINLDPGIMLSNPFDILIMVWPSVVILITKFTEIFTWDIIKNLFLQQSILKLEIIAAILITCVVLVKSPIFIRYKDKIIKEPKNKKNWLKSLFVPDEQDGFICTAVKAIIGGLTSLVVISIGLPFFTITVMMIIIILVITLTFMPLIGLSTGQQYFDKYVLKPENCITIKSGYDRLKPKDTTKSTSGATCVLIKSMDKNNPYTNYGRVALSTANYILLYHKDTGLGERIPIANLIVQNIDDEQIKELGSHKH